MNDEEITLQPTLEQNVPSGEPSATDETPTNGSTLPPIEDTIENETEAIHSLEEGGFEDVKSIDGMPQEADADPSLSANPLQNSDSDPGVPALQAPSNGIDELRNELKQLREQLASRDAFFTRLGNEYEEFKALYPDTSPETLSENIWKDVLRGVPLAAAYALAERRRQHAEAQAEKSNLENRLRSPGAVSGSEKEYFTPAEVRAMSRQEVRDNYQKIMYSMKKWK